MKYKKLFKLRARKFHFLINFQLIRNRVGLLLFFELERFSPEKFYFPKYKETKFCEKIQQFWKFVGNVGNLFERIILRLGLENYKII